MIGNNNKGLARPPKRRSTKSSFGSTFTPDVLLDLSGECSFASQSMALRVQLSLAPPALSPCESLERFQEKLQPSASPTPPQRKKSVPSLDIDDSEDIAFLLASLPLDTMMHSE